MRFNHLYQTLLENYSTQRDRWVKDGAEKDDVVSYLELHKDLKKRNLLKGKERDIDTFTTFDQLVSTLTQAQTEVTKTKQKRIAKDEGAEIIYDDENYLVVQPKTYEASCYYGAGTKWCTASKNRTHWDEYAKEGTIIYYVIDKSDDFKIAFVIDGIHTDVYDEEDETIPLRQATDLMLKKLPSKIKKILKGVEFEHFDEDGKLHKDDGPAVKLANGTAIWYFHGRKHRRDGPAIIHPDGTQEWFNLNGHHRIGGPAVEHPDGRETWFYRNKMHREDGPADYTSPNDYSWYYHGKLHRLDGPALEQPHHKKFYINGRSYSEENYWKHPDVIAFNKKP